MVYPTLRPFFRWMTVIESDIGVRVIRLRVRSSPPASNKTRERRTTMERSWWRTFASNWPPPSRLGPPSQAWPVAPSNPRAASPHPRLVNRSALPLFHWHTQPCTFGLRSRGEVVFAVWTQPTIKPLTAGTQKPWPGTRTLRKLASSGATSDTSATAMVINVMY